MDKMMQEEKSYEPSEEAMSQAQPHFEALEKICDSEGCSLQSLVDKFESSPSDQSEDESEGGEEDSGRGKALLVAMLRSKKSEE